jgi:uncharacterized membrane protein YtjA (UPF0391 family)
VLPKNSINYLSHSPWGEGDQPSTINSQPSPIDMLYYAVVFLIIALIAAILGFGGIAGTAAWIAKICFIVFLIFAIISFLKRPR